VSHAVERSPRALSLALIAALGAACSDPAHSSLEPSGELADLAGTRQALVAEDGLHLAYERFKSEFVALERDRAFDIGLGPFPELGTERLGRAPLFFDFEQVDGQLTGSFQVRTVEGFELPSDLAYDLWAGRNVAGAGRSMRPEAGDQFTRLGVIAAGDRRFRGVGASFRKLGGVDFVLLTRKGRSPAAGSVAIANLSLFEKRFFAEQFGWQLASPAGVASAAVPTSDPLIQRGFAVFFEETFGGNGRTCGSCHRAENNFTIDAPFIATLPDSDPLLKAARDVPGLEGIRLDDPLGLILESGLILENLDGPSPEGHVFRSVQHTLGLTATTTRPRLPVFAGEDMGTPPDERTGWSGDGSPGRGTLHDFAVGAIAQHLTQDVARRVGIDFRLPTQEEADALEAFQLSLGRSKDLALAALAFHEPAAQNGMNLFRSQGLCFICHSEAGARSPANPRFNNVNVDQGVERRPETFALGLPPDAGFGKAAKLAADGTFEGFGDGRFNVQTLIEAADTAPFFHNNSAATLEDAVRHYTTEAFDPELAGFAPDLRPQLDESQVRDVAAFLRVLNAAENVREVRKKLAYVRDSRSTANSALLDLALADVNDAFEVLAQPGRTLGGAQAQHTLATLRQLVQQTRAHPDGDRAAYAAIAVSWAEAFLRALFSANPNQEFLTD
jgi:cytochrome c peroxidase